jgi:hypothetical protein
MRMRILFVHHTMHVFRGHTALNDFFVGGMPDLPATDRAFHFSRGISSFAISRKYHGKPCMLGLKLYHTTIVFGGHAALDDFFVGGTPGPFG